MAKRIDPRAGEPSLPSREQIVDFIAQATDKIGKREIAQAFGIKGADKIGLKRILKEIEEDGAIARGRGGLSKAGRLPPVVLADIRARDRNGDFLAFPAEWDAGKGKPPTIVLHAPRGGRKPRGLTAGIGDRALLRVEPDGADGRYTGRVVKVIGKNKAEIIGVFREGAGEGWRTHRAGREARAGPRDPDPAGRGGRGARGRSRQRDAGARDPLRPAARPGRASAWARSAPRRR